MGELISADFVHRKGQFRATQTGDIVDFTLPPYGTVHYLNAEADLRDLPLGTAFVFSLHANADGAFTQLATIEDQFTVDMGQGITHRLEEVLTTEGKLRTTKRCQSKKQDNLGQNELLFSPETKIWIGARQGSIQDLKPGDELLYNLSANTPTGPGVCTDIWVGPDTHSLVSETQQKEFDEFLKDRGLPGWINKTEGRKVTVTFFSGYHAHFQKTWGEVFTPCKEVKLCIANDELRTWNPPVDGERSTIDSIEAIPTDGHGSSGMRAVLVSTNMLEGFRKGRVVRVFGPGWKVKDQPYGESLMGYGFAAMKNQELVENAPKEYPDQFPFRTDFGNRHLPWFQLKDGAAPPRFAEHVLKGELIAADPGTRTGSFRAEPTGEVVRFTLRESPLAVAGTTKKQGDNAVSKQAESTPVIRYCGANVAMSGLPLGQRYRFHMFQDATGTFNHCTLICDEYSHLASNAVTLRIESINAPQGKISAAHQLPLVKDYNGDMQRPADIARSQLRYNQHTRIWRDKEPLHISALKPGDTFLFNSTAEAPGKPAVCTDLWLISEPSPAPSGKEGKEGKGSTGPR